MRLRYLKAEKKMNKSSINHNAPKEANEKCWESKLSKLQLLGHKGFSCQYIEDKDKPVSIFIN